MTDPDAAPGIDLGAATNEPAGPDDAAPPTPQVDAPLVVGERIDTEAIMNALRGVIDPELGGNVVDLGMIKRFERTDDDVMHVTMALTTAGCPLRAQLMRDAKARVGSLPGIDTVKIHFGEMTAAERSDVMARARWKARDNALDTDIPPTCRILAISSGKGGVGKSSVTANLAVLLADRGHVVGVLDADVGGFSMPHLLGLDGEVEGERAVGGKTVMRPVVRPIGSGELRVVSMGSIAGRERDRGHHVARHDAQPRCAALPGGRRVGKPRLPADRHAPGNL